MWKYLCFGAASVAVVAHRGLTADSGAAFPICWRVLSVRIEHLAFHFFQGALWTRGTLRPSTLILFKLAKGKSHPSYSYKTVAGHFAAVISSVNPGKLQTWCGFRSSISVQINNCGQKVLSKKTRCWQCLTCNKEQNLKNLPSLKPYCLKEQFTTPQLSDKSSQWHLFQIFCLKNIQ